MNWINSVVRPKIRSILRKKDMPDNLWVKCPETGQMIYYKDLEANQFVVPGSNYHMRMSAGARLKALFDDGDYETLALPEVPLDPLKFRDERRYTDRLKDARSKTGMTDAVLAGAGRLEGQRIVGAAQDFDFLGGSLGTAAGEAVVAAIIAEPGALIGFAGPRVIEQTIREQLPNGFQRAEYLHDHGMVDMVVHRHALRGTLARICQLLTHRRPGRDVALSEPIDGKVARVGPPSTITLSGNGLDTAVADDDDALTGGAGNGANPNPPQSV